MCSQYYLELKMLLELEEQIDYPFELELNKTITYYPSNQIPIIELKNHQLTGNLFKWGYQLSNNKLVINARQETLSQKTLFKDDLKNHRCIIPASGFYEWDEYKQKFSFEHPRRKPLLMAGIYRQFQQQKEVTIITTKANDSINNIHQRMPLIFNWQQAKDWLNNQQIELLLKKQSEALLITSGNLQTSLF